MFSDPRIYADKGKVPIWNGPVRVVTPPAAVPQMSPADRRIFEFLVPYPILMVDRAEWPPLHVDVDGTPVEIYKPVGAVGAFEPIGRLGNESPEAYCTIIRATMPVTASLSPEPLWKLLEVILAWIRVRSRQYWLLHGSTGFGATFRGSKIEHGRMDNFVGCGPTIVVRPFSREMWADIGKDITTRATPPLSESILCDALLSVVAGDEIKALLELGVACEIELTNLLAAAAKSTPSTPDKAAFIADDGDWDRFKVKLRNWPQRLGMDDVATYSPAEVPTDWVTLVLELYKLRNGVAHGGRKNVAGTSVQTYVFAANALFRYSAAQKGRLSLSHYGVGPEADPADQVVLYRDNYLFSNATLSP
ncbi:MAG TPA: hypothetical protein VFO25_08170 [Candidatus Eremiobacteraceae bacterium]|nr:hypothetical protein [Candidatus Eremiobacteraceae bacterium]